jgi:hypothetical protein
MRSDAADPSQPEEPMSELTNQVRMMLNQAQKFAADAPLEAVSRARLALDTAQAGLAKAGGEETRELRTLIELAEAGIERYELTLASWFSQVRAREEQYNQNERERLQRPLPPKV